MLVDLYLVYQFIRRLTTPFNEWEAFRLGIIDKDGNILKKKDQRKTSVEKDAFGVYDVMILKLKRLLEKVPGGQSKIASYAAALWLIREWNHFSDSSILTESISEDILDESVESFYERYFNYITHSDFVNIKEDGAPTVNVGSGNIAGLGVGPQGEPGLTRSQQKKHKKRAAASFNPRKTFSDFLKDDLTVPNLKMSDLVVGEPGTGDTAGEGTRPKRRYKKHTKVAAQ